MVFFCHVGKSISLYSDRRGPKVLALCLALNSANLFRKGIQSKGSDLKFGFRAVAVILALFVACSSWAGVSIGSGGSISLGQGALDLGGTDLQIDGQLDIEAGSIVEAGNVAINGVLEGGSGAVAARGNWTNNGSFNAGTGSVQLLDDSGSSSHLIGASNFHSLSMTSSSGGSFVLESGQTQRVTNALTVQGVGGQPVQIRSSSSPQVAELLLEPGGSQNIALVGVSDVHATGQRLAPGQVNQGGNDNDFGWFGGGLPHAVPTLSFGSLLLLILAFFGVALVRRGAGA